MCEFRDSGKAKNINKTLHHVVLSPRSVTLMRFSRIFPGPDCLKPQADTVGWLEPMSAAWIEDAVVVFHAMSSSGLEEAMPAEGTSGRGCRQRVWPRRHCAPCWASWVALGPLDATAGQFRTSPVRSRRRRSEGPVLREAEFGQVERPSSVSVWVASASP